MSNSEAKKNWLEQPGNTDKLFYAAVAFAILVSIPDILALFHILYEKHPYTEMEEIPVFYGLYAMVSFLTLLVAARAASRFLKRDEDYYD